MASPEQVTRDAKFAWDKVNEGIGVSIRVSSALYAVIVKRYGTMANIDGTPVRLTKTNLRSGVYEIQLEAMG